jgi:hypothetical protein
MKLCVEYGDKHERAAWNSRQRDRVSTEADD